MTILFGGTAVPRLFMATALGMTLGGSVAVSPAVPHTQKDDGIRFACAPAQLARVVSGMDEYLASLKISNTLVVKRLSADNASVVYTLNTPEEDTDTRFLKNRPELELVDQVLILPANGGTTQKVVTVSQKEIVLALLQHGRLTEFNGEACNLEALKDHVGIRQNTVAWAEVLEWGWPDGDSAAWNKKFWNRGTPTPGHPLHTAVMDTFINQKKYSIGCYTATKLSMIQGVLDYYHRLKKDDVKLRLVENRLLQGKEPLEDIEPGKLWSFEEDLDPQELNRPGKLLSITSGVAPNNLVPGDWLYFLNTDPITHEKIGYEGSNAIYLGRGKFDDYYNDNHHSYTYREKLNEVYQWRNGVFSRSRDAAKVVPISDTDIERLSTTPENGGILLSLRVSAYRFGFEPLPQWEFTD